MHLVTKTLNVYVTRDDHDSYSVFDEETGILVADLTWERAVSLLHDLGIGAGQAPEDSRR